MAGVGQTGYWRTGVWVEPLDADGSFQLTSVSDLSFTGRFLYSGSFDLSATALILFDGTNLFLGEFTQVGTAEMAFTGDFIENPGQGIFGLSANAKLMFAWVPELGPPTGGGADIKEGPASVEIPFGPGDVFVLDGTTGVVVKDSRGRLLVLNSAGEVMCILGPSGVEIV